MELPWARVLPTLLHWAGFSRKASGHGKYGKSSFWKEEISLTILTGHLHRQTRAAGSDPLHCSKPCAV